MSQIQFRRGSAAQWTSANPTLAAGEVGIETDNEGTGQPLRLKVGDGVAAWTSLSYFSSISRAGIIASGLEPSDIGADISGAAASEASRAQTAEALLAPLASPALSGAPTAPTATVGDNSTKLATTAFVLANGGSGGTPGGDASGTIPALQVNTVLGGKTPLETSRYLGFSQVVRPSGDSTGATDAAAIQAALNGGTNTSIYLNGNYTVNATLLIPSGITVVLADAYITVAAAVNGPVFANSTWTSSTASNSDIHIRGVGRAIIDGNNTNNSIVIPYKASCVTFIAVSNLTITDVQTQFATSNHIMLQGCTNVRARNLRAVINGTDHGYFHTDVGCSNIAIDGVQGVGTFTDSVFSINTVVQGTGSFSPWAQAQSGSARNISNISFRNVQLSSSTGLYCFWVDASGTISTIDIENTQNTYTGTTSGEEIQFGFAGDDSVSLSAQGSISGIRVNGYTFSGQNHVLVQIGNAGTDIQCSNIRCPGTVQGLLGFAVVPNTGVQAGYFPQLSRVKFTGVVIQTLAAAGALCQLPAGYQASDIEFENITIGTASGPITSNGCDITGFKIHGLHVGTLSVAPFQDTGNLIGEVSNFTYDQKGAALTAVLPSVVRFKIGQPFPPLAAADATPKSVPSSRIVCYAGKDPTGGSGTSAGVYDGGGAAGWILGSNLGAVFHPGQIFMPLLYHYDAANIVGVANGGAVSKWPDDARNIALVQATTANQPTFVASDAILNNKPSVAFNGSSQFIQNSNSLTPVSQAHPYSIFMVWYVTTLTGTQVVLGLSTPGVAAFPEYEVSTTHTLVNLGSAGINSPTTPVVNTAYVAAVCAGSSTTGIVGENKAAFASLGSGTAGTTAMTGVTVGSGGAGSSFAAIHVAELFAYSGLISSGDYATVAAGLATKYAVTLT